MPVARSGILSHETIVTERYPQRVAPAPSTGSSSVARVEQGHVAQTEENPGKGIFVLPNAPQAAILPPSAAQVGAAPIDVYSLSTSAHLLALPKNTKAQGPQEAHTKSQGDGAKRYIPTYGGASAYAPYDAGGAKALEKKRPLPPEWQGLIREASQIFGLEEQLLAAVIRVESGFDAWAESPAGAQGAMQIMPRTQIELGLIDPFDPRANIYAGAEYLLRQIQRFGDMRLALAAYNAGPANVEKYGGIPPFAETQNYVTQVMRLWHTSN